MTSPIKQFVLDYIAKHGKEKLVNLTAYAAVMVALREQIHGDGDGPDKGLALAASIVGIAIGIEAGDFIKYVDLAAAAVDSGETPGDVADLINGTKDQEGGSSWSPSF